MCRSPRFCRRCFFSLKRKKHQAPGCNGPSRTRRKQLKLSRLGVSQLWVCHQRCWAGRNCRSLFSSSCQLLLRGGQLGGRCGLVHLGNHRGGERLSQVTRATNKPLGPLLPRVAFFAVIGWQNDWVMDPVMDPQPWLLKQKPGFKLPPEGFEILPI